MTRENKPFSILFITLSNIGDCILTWPVLDSLWEHWPQASVTVVCGPKAANLFEGHPRITSLLVYDKRTAWRKKFHFVKALRRKEYDVVIDLRHSLIPWMVRARLRPSPFWPRHRGHARIQHLEQWYRLMPQSAGRRPQRHAFYVSESDRLQIERLLSLDEQQKRSWLLLAPGAADEAKRWPADHFAQVAAACHRKYGWSSVIVAAENERPLAEQVSHCLRQDRVPHLNLAGCLNLRQLCAVTATCHLVVCNDSAVMHMASYFDRPVVAVFGPTNPQRYGAWSLRHANLRSSLTCARCNGSGDRHRPHTCLSQLPAETVLKVIEKWHHREWV